MVKSDFKNGMSFRTRHEEKYYILNDEVYKKIDEYTLELCEPLEKWLNNYDEDLLVLYASPHGADVMEVYDIENNLVWKRDEIDWSKVPIDTKVLVRKDKNADWIPRHFAGYSIGYYCTYPEGRTSWTNEKGNVHRWNYCKLAEEIDKQITVEKLHEEFEGFCKKTDCVDCPHYYMEESCEICWLLDNYNVTEK